MKFAESIKKRGGKVWVVHAVVAGAILLPIAFAALVLGCLADAASEFCRSFRHEYAKFADFMRKTYKEDVPKEWKK